MNATVRFLCSCGGVAADIRSALGSRCNMRKVKPYGPVGNYGDFIFESSKQDAIWVAKKHPNFVYIL